MKQWILKLVEYQFRGLIGATKREVRIAGGVHDEAANLDAQWRKFQAPSVSLLQL